MEIDLKKAQYIPMSESGFFAESSQESMTEDEEPIDDDNFVHKCPHCKHKGKIHLEDMFIFMVRSILARKVNEFLEQNGSDIIREEIAGKKAKKPKLNRGKASGNLKVDFSKLGH